jgi:hypothetical protein
MCGSDLSGGTMQQICIRNSIPDADNSQHLMQPCVQEKSRSTRMPNGFEVIPML